MLLWHLPNATNSLQALGIKWNITKIQTLREAGVDDLKIKFVYIQLIIHSTQKNRNDFRKRLKVTKITGRAYTRNKRQFDRKIKMYTCIKQNVNKLNIKHNLCARTLMKIIYIIMLNRA